MAICHPLLPCCFRSIYPLDLSYIYRQATFSPLLSLSVFAPSCAACHCGETGYLRNAGKGGMRGETAGKPLKYAGNGDFRRGTEARIINNLEMRMRRRRSALFLRSRGCTTAAARRGAHIRRIRKSPGNARITAFPRLLDGMSRSAPSRKSQQQTKRTRALRLMLLL